jgi:cleavage and polyadenylation specificity factor subunit 3
MGVLDLKHTTEHEITLEWESGASNDMIADSTIALIAGIDKSPASVKSRVEPLTFFFLVSLTPSISLIG